MTVPSSLCAVVLVGTICSCDSFYVVRGRVASCADHRPLQGAIVHLVSEHRVGYGTTEADGSYIVALNEPEGDNTSKVTLAKVGYVTVEHAVDNPHVEQNVCLRPAEK